MSVDTTSETRSGWQLAGSAADAYERWLVPAIFATMARRLVAVAGLSPGDRVLDAACGTGIVARTAAGVAGPAGMVTGVDVNPDMLEVATRAAADVRPPILWHRGDVAALPFEDDCFDVALCEEAIQFFDDPVAGIRELARVVRPGGRVVFSVLRGLGHHQVYSRFVDALETHAGASAAAMMASPFAFGGGGRCRAVALEAGLTSVVVQVAVAEERFPSVEEFVRREAASSPLAEQLARLDDASRRALVTRLEADLEPHIDDLGIVFPNETCIVTGHA